MKKILWIIAPMIMFFIIEVQSNSYLWRTLAFETPVKFSPPSSIGMDAVSLVYPSDAAAGRNKVEIVLALASKGMVEAMGFKTDGEIKTHLKTTFIGASNDSITACKRSFMGKSVDGDRQTQIIPRRLNLETYLIALAGGDTIIIAFRSDPSMDSSQLEQIISSVADTLQEKKPDAPSNADPSLQDLRKAPSEIVIASRKISFSAYLWRDFMPVQPPGGKPMMVSLKLAAADKKSLPEGLIIEKVWLIQIDELWSSLPEEIRPVASDPLAKEILLRNAPKWNPGTKADVVLQITDSSNHTHFIRAANQLIEMTQ